MKNRIFTFMLLFFIAVLASISYAHNSSISEVYFTPSSDCEDRIIYFIEKSQKIDIAVYSISNEKIFRVLQRAYGQGKKIRILTDKLQASGRYSKVVGLYENGLDIRVNSKHKIEHNKFAIFDDEIIKTGSYNWTDSASNKNSENCLFTNDIAFKDKYINHFSHLWKINSSEKSNLWFEKKLASRI